jgi:gliding motility-associated-like protein
MKRILSVACFVLNYTVFCQTVNNIGGFITAQPGSFIHVNGSVSNNGSGILTVNGNGTASSSELYVTQDVVNNAIINADGYIRLLGNWIDNSDFNSTSGTVFFEGGNQFLGGSSVTTFFNITLDGTGIKTQQVDKIANGTLDLKSLQLNTDVYEFFVSNPALNAIQRTTGFVSSANGGYLSRSTQNTGTYLFPTGSTANTSANIPGSAPLRYRPVEINPADNTSNIYSVRLANLDATSETYNRSSKDPIICTTNPSFYHQINRLQGSSNASLGVCYVPAEDGGWSDLARWNINTTGIWQDVGNVNIGVIPGFSKATATNWSNFNDIPYILSNLNPDPPVILADSLSGCAPLTVNFQTTGAQGTTYIWSSNGNDFGSGTQSNQTFSNSGCYDITLSANNGTCSSSTTILNMVCVDDAPNAYFFSDPNEFSWLNPEVNFTNASTGASSYTWDFGNNLNSFESDPSMSFDSINNSILVTLYAYSPAGCMDSITGIINYVEEAIYYVPNSFTPDQNEFNETWGPVFTEGFDPFNFDLYVFNRWGELVWESHDANVRWDGTYGANAMRCPDGIYTWKITFKPKETDERIDLVGHLSLLR